jgi:hypothetical protein
MMKSFFELHFIFLFKSSALIRGRFLVVPSFSEDDHTGPDMVQ